MDVKGSELFSLQEAIDNLTTVSMMNMENPPPMGILNNRRIVTDEAETPAVLWISGEGSEAILEVLDLSYLAIHHHLQGLLAPPLSDDKERQGIAAMMDLVAESAHKMDLYLAYRLGKKATQTVETREAFKALQRFYSERFGANEIEGDKAWASEWSENEKGQTLDVLGSHLKDFEAVQRDQEYELFYIRNEEGRSYFSPELLRNIRLTTSFDVQTASFEEDPLLKVRAMIDRDLQASASQILKECHPFIEDFYKIARRLSGNAFAQFLSMSLLGLFLAANFRYLLQNTTGKSCLQYFEDFHRFLRGAMKTPEYQKAIAYPPDASDKTTYTLLDLTHRLCHAFFYRIGGVKQEVIGLLHRTMRRGEQVQEQPQKAESFWNQLLIDDEKLRAWFVQFPNGPLFKILDLIREMREEDTIIPFDPLAQGNLPSFLFEVRHGGKHLAVLRIPTPTQQSFINKASVLDEFRGFFRARTNKKHLLIHLQDRTSWRESARCYALEAMQKNAEFSSQLMVLTLPQESAFYHQNEAFSHLNQASDFFAHFKMQLTASDGGEFLFPLHWPQEAVLSFVDALFPLIHEHFFRGQKTLSRQEREDFIEIFYLFLILKAIDQLAPDSLSFTCKDAIDAGAAASALFYGFVLLVKGPLNTREEQDFLRWLFYAPALFVRERLIDPKRLHRALAALERLDRAFSQHRDTLIRAFAPLYSPQLFKDLAPRYLFEQ